MAKAWIHDKWLKSALIVLAVILIALFRINIIWFSELKKLAYLILPSVGSE